LLEKQVQDKEYVNSLVRLEGGPKALHSAEGPFEKRLKDRRFKRLPFEISTQVHIEHRVTGIWNGWFVQK
jgi:hypothetical protein